MGCLAIHWNPSAHTHSRYLLTEKEQRACSVLKLRINYFVKGLKHFKANKFCYSKWIFKENMT